MRETAAFYRCILTPGVTIPPDLWWVHRELHRMTTDMDMQPDLVQNVDHPDVAPKPVNTDDHIDPGSKVPWATFCASHVLCVHAFMCCAHTAALSMNTWLCVQRGWSELLVCRCPRPWDDSGAFVLRGGCVRPPKAHIEQSVTGRH